MPAIPYLELIDRAKQAGDMHDGFPSNKAWLYFANAEINKLHVKTTRSGYPLAVSDESIVATGAIQYDISEPFAVIGAYGIAPSGRRYKIPIKRIWDQYDVVRTGVYPKECYVGSNVSTGQIYIRFYPKPESGTFILTVVPKPDKLVSTVPGPGESNNLTLPHGWDERVVLGMAQRALTKEQTINPGIEREISALDEQIDMHAYDYVLQQSNTVTDVDSWPDYRDWYYV